MMFHENQEVEVFRAKPSANWRKAKIVTAHAKFYRVEFPNGTRAVLAAEHLRAVLTMTALQYRKALAALELSIVGAAPVLGISRRQSQRLAAGESPVPAPVEKLLDHLLKERKATS